MQKQIRANGWKLLITAATWLVLSVAQAESENAGRSETDGFFLSFQAGTLSANIEQSPLAEVLQELARQANLEVSVVASLAAERVSARFERLPLEQGIERLLVNKNYTLRYIHETSGPRVAEIRIASDKSEAIGRIGSEGDLAPASESPPQSPEGKSLDELAHAAVSAPDPQARIDALKALGTHRADAKAQETIASALKDGDREVRDVALNYVQGEGVSVPLETLTAMALKDASPELRLHALDELVESSEPEEVMEQLQQAAQDPDPNVQAYAKHWLKRAEGQAQP